jgi:hypothetical protein
MKMKLLYFICVNIFVINIYSQQHNFFPLNIGNEYQMYDGYEHQFGKIERDTVYPNGKTYFQLSSPFVFQNARVDTLGNILSISKPFFGGGPEEHLLFKADATLDEIWIISDSINPLYMKGYGKCIYIDSGYIFGKNRLIKGVLIYDDSYYYYYYWLAEGIGLVRDQFDDGTVSLLNYAKIDGKIYGTLVSAEDENSSLPTEFSLNQNFPNPFNPTTNIQYAIGSRQFVSLKVYDILGNEITTLVNEEKPSGNYEVEFNPASWILNPASGIYFYQLRAGDYIETKKMILLK